MTAEQRSTPNLNTTYLGMDLRSPLVISSNPTTRTVDSLLDLEQAGAGAVVLPSLFQEEVEAEELAAMQLAEVGDSFAEFGSAPLADVDASGLGTERHLHLVTAAKEALSIPVVASVNGARPGDWARYGKMLAEAGADALELNLYGVNTDPTISAAQVEERYLAIIDEVKQAIDIPLAVKLSQNYQSLSNFAVRAESAGADALVLFNRFLGPDIDLEKLRVVPRVALSTPAELRLRLRWIAILRSQMPGLGLAATGGVHSSEDVVKSLSVGADVACLASSVLAHGPKVITDLLEGLRAWLAAHEYTGVDELRGSMSSSSVDDPGEFERAQYVQAITTWTPDR
ncbi:dihydroorotate dehydrogenase (fumarate) [Austwickia chelonae]|uniref:Dihydroorotate dehydrogenase family protein n=1 Tax=Austwickia chelonae NBRC 105200 TaxID=1184607 RepID=K6ULS9_9MICO|nr:dihydroorotate dehydrogenase-like protein [Austwickia chelonae]GAB77516.1 dihydroorotate dehydrogenase family protein [Austwickia chelonae NBRC 105200]SEW11965.1 dihydroorotate dehydrogenase (fumarate) [Austwickia chelonae]